MCVDVVHVGKIFKSVFHLLVELNCCFSALIVYRG